MKYTFLATTLLTFLIFLTSCSCSGSDSFPRVTNLKEAAKVMEVEIPVPHYFPEDYDIQKVALTSNSTLNLLITNSDDNKIELHISCKALIPYKLVPPTVDLNDNEGSLAEDDDSNILIWNLFSGSGNFVLKLSAHKHLPISELILIAKSVR